MRREVGSSFQRLPQTRVGVWKRSFQVDCGAEFQGPGWGSLTPDNTLVPVTCAGPRLSDLANKNTGCLIKCEFQLNHE